MRSLRFACIGFETRGHSAIILPCANEARDPGAIRTRDLRRHTRSAPASPWYSSPPLRRRLPYPLLLRSWILTSNALLRANNSGDPGAIRTRDLRRHTRSAPVSPWYSSPPLRRRLPYPLLLRSWILTSNALPRTEGYGDPGAIRTRDFQLRRLALYPAELPGQIVASRCTAAGDERKGSWWGVRGGA